MEPFNVEAIAKLRQCDEMIKTWSKSGVKPEQFTGEKTKNILSREELEGGYNAWLRKVRSFIYTISFYIRSLQPA